MTDHDFATLEDRLRAALHHDATSITPSDRLAELRSATASGSAPASPAAGWRLRDWALPATSGVAAATLALVAWIAWPSGPRPQIPARPATTTSATLPSTTGTTPPTSSPMSPSANTTATASASSSASSTSTFASSTSTSNAPSTSTGPATVPAYFVGAVGAAGDVTWKLYREFFITDTPASADPSDIVAAALRRSLDAQALSNYADYLQPWSGTTLVSVNATPELLTIALSNGGADGFEGEQQRLAVQQLVWTAQAAYGQGRVPVTFLLADGATHLFGRFPADAQYDRPDPGQEGLDVAPVWITAPSRDQQLPIGGNVTVTGLAIAPQARLAWELRRGTVVITSGTTAVSAAAPSQAAYAIELGELPAGDYQVTVWTPNPDDGSRSGANSTTFTVA